MLNVLGETFFQSHPPPPFTICFDSSLPDFMCHILLSSCGQESLRALWRAGGGGEAGQYGHSEEVSA